jgi:hypothetical protein
MGAQEVDTSYEPHAADPIYVAVNQALVDTIDLAKVARVADLACGTGLAPVPCICVPKARHSYRLPMPRSTSS